MAIFIQPTLPVSFVVGGKVASAPSSISVTQAKPAIVNAFGPIQPGDIDGRYSPPLILFVG